MIRHKLYVFIFLICVTCLINSCGNGSSNITNSNLPKNSWTDLNGESGGYSYGFAISTNNNGISYIAGSTSVALSGQVQSGTSDYYIAQYNNNGKLQWLRQVGESNITYHSYGISRDNLNNAYIVGVTGSSHFAYFIAKYSESGELIWSHQSIESDGSRANAVSTDNNGNSYVTGYITVGVSGQYNYFLAKYSESGALLWFHEAGESGGITKGYGVSVDNNGSVFVTGDTNVGISGQTQIGLSDYFLAKYTESGVLLWTKQIGESSANIRGRGITVDSQRNILTTGFTDTAIHGQTQVGLFDYWLAKFTESGELIWARQGGAVNGNSSSFAIAADDNNNAYITGYATQEISQQAQAGKKDYYIVKYNSEGVQQWALQVGATGGNAGGAGIGVDTAGGIYTTGSTDTSISGQSLSGHINYYITKWQQ